jgi:hypothetical protein
VPLQCCRVTFTDKQGIEHQVEVQAESVFEAAALALRSFRRDNWTAGEPLDRLAGRLRAAAGNPS